MGTCQPLIDKNYDDDKGDNDADQKNGNNDDDDDGKKEDWLEAAGGRDDVNHGVDRLHCSVLLSALLVHCFVHTPLNAQLHYTAL